MKKTNNDNIVRFAPSPTGFLHLGGARTAIFNWLFARKNNGKFLLRIEDTDVQRSSESMVEAILNGLSWLKLDWDEKPVYQSRRLQNYDEFIEKLIDSGKAYRCFCTKDMLSAEQQRVAREKFDYKYRHKRTCLNLTDSELTQKLEKNQPYSVRFILPEGKTSFTDHVYGSITVDHRELDDFIIRRMDGYPTYHFAVVADDHEMNITHIIRGDDHLSNTPKHVLLYKALNWELPDFVHVPLILGPDKQRLSKRHGATSVGEYRNSGYLPETLFNYLSLLGWSPGDDRELFEREDLVDAFSLDGISKKSAVFDEKKLQWMNGQYILALPDESFREIVINKLRESGQLEKSPIENSKLNRICDLIKPRLKRLDEIEMMTGYFFKDPEQFDEKGVRKYWKGQETVEQLEMLKEGFRNLKDFSETAVEQMIRSLAAELDLSAAKIIHPCRLALTGMMSSPGLFEVIVIFGRDTVVRRLNKAIEAMKQIDHSQAT